LQHGDERRRQIGPLRLDASDRRAGEGAVDPGDHVDVLAQARLV
jgi:hypothetical protein